MKSKGPLYTIPVNTKEETISCLRSLSPSIEYDSSFILISLVILLNSDRIVFLENKGIPEIRDTIYDEYIGNSPLSVSGDINLSVTVSPYSLNFPKKLPSFIFTYKKKEYFIFTDKSNEYKILLKEGIVEYSF